MHAGSHCTHDVANQSWISLLTYEDTLYGAAYCWSCFFFEMTWCEISLLLANDDRAVAHRMRTSPPRPSVVGGRESSVAES